MTARGRRYKLHLRWEHYKHRLQGQPVLPAETEACASVTSAFLQVPARLGFGPRRVLPAASALQSERQPG